MAFSFGLTIRRRLGVGCKGPNEIGILDRIVKVDDKGLDYEADPKRVNRLAESLGITIANSFCSPGVKNPDVAREPESKTSDNPANVDSDSAATQVSSPAESALEAHATRQELEPDDITEPQTVH